MNITKLCKYGGKQFFNWKGNSSSKELANSCYELKSFDNLVNKRTADLLRGTYGSLDVANVVINWMNLSLPKNPDGYVYIISSDAFIKENLYKIGYTNNIDRRLYSLRAGNPFLKIIYKIHTDNAKILEQKIHIEYESSRYDREWFKIEDIDKCIEYINEHKK